MKYRLSFVTNSSSSSFLINKKDLTEEQIKLIWDHSDKGEELGIEYAEEAWNIEENNSYIGGATFMDNFSMEEYFEKIGIKDDSVEWSDRWSVELPEEE